MVYGGLSLCCVVLCCGSECGACGKPTASLPHQIRLHSLRTPIAAPAPSTCSQASSICPGHVGMILPSNDARLWLLRWRLHRHHQ